MAAYVARRLVLAAAVLLGLTLVTFVVARVVPSDPAAQWVGARATLAEIARARVLLGLNQPLPVQYERYMADLLHLNLGVSIDTHQPVLENIGQYLPNSLLLVLSGMFLGVAFGLPLGAWAALRPHGTAAAIARVTAVGAVSMPTFWLALLLQLLFFGRLGWLPLSGDVNQITLALSPLARTITGVPLVDAILEGNWAVAGDALRHLVLPALTMASYPFGLTVRMARASLLDALAEDHARSARAWGMPERVVAFHYALRVALPPVITVLALTLAYSLTGTFLIESVFAWPGIGAYTANAIVTADYPAVMGVTLVVGVAYVLLNLVVDLVIALIDPRVRYA
jgi:peptide/nickel transport system permease protein